MAPAHVHANGARFFFICLYIHIGRGLYFSSFLFIHTWIVGVLLLFAVIAAAFFGYVLPWGQISFWGATVITNLFSAIPYFGGDLVIWLWGGFAVDNATLTRFFSFHFLIPFVAAALTLPFVIFTRDWVEEPPGGFKKHGQNLVSSVFYLKRPDRACNNIVGTYCHLSLGPLGSRGPREFYPC